MIYLIGTVAQPRRIGRGLLLILAAMVIHGVWDSAAALGGGTVLAVLIMIVTTVVAVVALFVALRLGVGRERRFMRAILAPEVTSGTITSAELDAVAGDRKDRRTAVQRRPEGLTRRQEKHILAAARDLAGDLATSGGRESADVTHSRAEISRVRTFDADGFEKAAMIRLDAQAPVATPLDISRVMNRVTDGHEWWCERRSGGRGACAAARRRRDCSGRCRSISRSAPSRHEVVHEYHRHPTHRSVGCQVSRTSRL